MTQSRWKSPVIYGAIFAQVLSIGQFAGIWAKYGIDMGMVGNVFAGVLQLLVFVGVLNDPTSKYKF